MKKTLIHGGTLVNAKDSRKTDVLISVTGDIEKIAPSITAERDYHVIDAHGLLIMPLLVDCHVHFREPGFEHKATMQTESRAALAGGVGTVCEMPNTSPPTVTIAALADKVRRAADIEGCTLKFFFGITEALHATAMRDLWTGSSMEMKRLKHHCCGIKLYLDHSTGNQKVDGDIVGDIFKMCAELKIPLVAHCEDPATNAAAASANTSADVSAHSLMRPPEAEAIAIQNAIALVRLHGTALHVAHLSTKQGIDLVRNAKAEGLPVTCEVAPHHLFLTTDDYATLKTLAKMNPPLRTTDHRDALWEGIQDKTVDCVSTDHAPHTLEEKRAAEPLKAPSGVPGIETMIPLLLSVAAGKWPHPTSAKPAAAELAVSDIIRLCHDNPNRIFNLNLPKIEKDATARFVIVDPNGASVLMASALKTKCAWTPFEGWSVRGTIKDVIQWQ